MLAYELLTGQPPFVGRSRQGLLAAHVTEAPEYIGKRRASIPTALAALIMRCLEKRASERPQTALDVVNALDQITAPSGNTQPTIALPATSTANAVTAKGSFSSRLLIAALLLIAVVAIGAYWRMHRGEAVTGARSAGVRHCR